MIWNSHFCSIHCGFYQNLGSSHWFRAKPTPGKILVWDYLSNESTDTQNQNLLLDITLKYSLKFPNSCGTISCGTDSRQDQLLKRKTQECLPWTLGTLFFCISRESIHSVSRSSLSLVCNPVPSPRTLHLPVESSIVHSWVAGLKLPGLEFLAFSMGSESYFHCPLTQLRHRFSLGSVAELIGLYPPRLSKVIHVKLEVSISTN